MSGNIRKVIVIGAGASGMMAAVAAARAGAEVILLEKNEKLGKKLYITGKGRCNLTNACDVSVFFDNIVHGKKFLQSALRSFSNEDLTVFFEGAGLRLKIERGGRVFPESDKSSDVIKTLEKVIYSLGIKVYLNTAANKIFAEGGHFKEVSATSKNGDGRNRFAKGELRLSADAIIIAAGGLSYPSTGSTGDGYKFAESLGHSVTDLEPSLAALICEEDYIGRLEGLSLRNVEVSIKKDGLSKELYSGFGEMLFTANGVSGPLILTISALLGREINKSNREGGNGHKLYIDLKPALTAEQLDKRILRDFDGAKNRDFKNSLKALLPSGIIPVVIKLSGIYPEKKVNSITRAERMGLVRVVKEFPLTPVSTEGFDRAVVTSGGVVLDEINSSTMESKLVHGVYFAGEVMDTDALTGGFNLQTAFSTGHLAGTSAAEGDKR